MNQDKTKQNYEEYHYTKKEVAKYLFRVQLCAGQWIICFIRTGGA